MSTLATKQMKSVSQVVGWFVRRRPLASTPDSRVFPGGRSERASRAARAFLLLSPNIFRWSDPAPEIVFKLPARSQGTMVEKYLVVCRKKIYSLQSKVYN